MKNFTHLFSTIGILFLCTPDAFAATETDEERSRQTTRVKKRMRNEETSEEVTQRITVLEATAKDHHERLDGFLRLSSEVLESHEKRIKNLKEQIVCIVWELAELRKLLATMDRSPVMASSSSATGPEEQHRSKRPRAAEERVPSRLPPEQPLRQLIAVPTLEPPSDHARDTTHLTSSWTGTRHPMPTLEHVGEVFPPAGFTHLSDTPPMQHVSTSIASGDMGEKFPPSQMEMKESIGGIYPARIPPALPAATSDPTRLLQGRGSPRPPVMIPVSAAEHRILPIVQRDTTGISAVSSPKS